MNGKIEAPQAKISQPEADLSRNYQKNSFGGGRQQRKPNGANRYFEENGRNNRHSKRWFNRIKQADHKSIRSCFNGYANAQYGWHYRNQKNQRVH